MKVMLSIAGSDSSGGAGIQADIKTAEAFGVFCATALTVLTAQNTTGVRSIMPVPPQFLDEQLAMVMEDLPVKAVKIGMLYSTELIRVVERFVKTLSIPVVLDPVFLSKAGSPLLQPEAVEAMRALFPYATVLTPNQHEAKALFGEPYHVKAPCPVIVKHFTTEKESHDTLFYPNGTKRTFASPKLETKNLHGSGCSFSSAIAANLALGKPLEEAIMRSKAFIYHAIFHAPALGHGPGPLGHKQGGLHVR
ncbi:bifunctional hydroxymethylpyrimidine kinase/phosphomethylpyrimidine kinase [Sulfurospirillum sp. T05]|uniref:hydroxymethylpyrimidine kinase n=1 Tax=Sulfurospirillum tamanense TaxID=2813362 RepID=A0ABS2WPJ1_9BACT|nr:bifunctional hydroxymethylpyrimidine kinase/phosphomethylpyrimidine kinase [Sulfurospirillum tamanensis]MBN2963550.1 bifunctional hydroxymethylpyrimidine kinase/phosphomethylpyrimidine kinase [Sulfurospirillum tamanensis]